MNGEILDHSKDKLYTDCDIDGVHKHIFRTQWQNILKYNEHSTL